MGAPRPRRGREKIMKNSFRIALLALLLTTGCNKDEEVVAFSSELDRFTDQLMSRVEAPGELPGRIDAAQQYLDANGGGIRSRYAELSDVRGFQLGEEARTTFTDSVMNNTLRVSGLRLRFAMETHRDAALEAKIERLSSSYEALFE
jgi:hypothetical protein